MTPHPGNATAFFPKFPNYKFSDVRSPPSITFTLYMQARLLLTRCTTKLPNISPKLPIRHQSTGAQALRRGGRNLSARFEPPAQPAFLNTDEPHLHESAMKAQSIGLSPEGLSNPKTVEAAARLSNSKGGHGPHSNDNNIGGVKVVMPEKPSPPGPEGTQ